MSTATLTFMMKMNTKVGRLRWRLTQRDGIGSYKCQACKVKCTHVYLSSQAEAAAREGHRPLQTSGLQNKAEFVYTCHLRRRLLQAKGIGSPRFPACKAKWRSWKGCCSGRWVITKSALLPLVQCTTSHLSPQVSNFAASTCLISLPPCCSH